MQDTESLAAKEARLADALAAMKKKRWPITEEAADQEVATFLLQNRDYNRSVVRDSTKRLLVVGMLYLILIAVVIANVHWSVSALLVVVVFGYGFHALYRQFSEPLRTDNEASVRRRLGLRCASPDELIDITRWMDSAPELRSVVNRWSSASQPLRSRDHALIEDYIHQTYSLREEISFLRARERFSLDLSAHIDAERAIAST